MKKIIALFVVMLAFGLNANAQQRKTTAPAAASKQQPDSEAIQQGVNRDMTLLSETVDLTDAQKETYKGLFRSKHLTLSNQNLSAERRESFSAGIEVKLKSVMTPDQIAKLDSNPEALKKLTH